MAGVKLFGIVRSDDMIEWERCPVCGELLGLLSHCLADPLTAAGMRDKWRRRGGLELRRRRGPELRREEVCQSLPGQPYSPHLCVCVCVCARC